MTDPFTPRRRPNWGAATSEIFFPRPAGYPEDFSRAWPHGLDFSGQGEIAAHEAGQPRTPMEAKDVFERSQPAFPRVMPAAAAGQEPRAASTALTPFFSRNGSLPLTDAGPDYPPSDFEAQTPADQFASSGVQDVQSEAGSLLVTSAKPEGGRHSDPNILDISTKGPVRAGTIMLNPRVSSVLCPAGPLVCPVELPKGFFDHSLDVHGQGPRSDGRSYFDPRLASQERLERLAFDTLRNGVARANPLLPGEYWISATFPFPVGYIKSFNLGGVLTHSPVVRYVPTNKVTLKVYGVPSPVRGAPQIPFKGATIYPDH